MTSFRIASLLSLPIVAGLLTANAFASDGEQAKIGKSPRLAEGVRENRRLIAMANRAQRLIWLQKDLELAETLIGDAIQGWGTTHWPFQTILTDLLELRGRSEEARVAFRPTVWPTKGVPSGSVATPTRLMRYALLSRKAGNRQEEEATLARIPGETLLQKMINAETNAREGYRWREQVAFLTEIQHLAPEANWVIPALALAEKNLNEQLRTQRKQALEIENGAKP